MEKLTNEERARREKLARDFRDEFNTKEQRLRDGMSQDMREFIGGTYGNLYYQKIYNGLKKGKKPSECFKKECQWLFDGWLLPRHKEAFYYSLDNCIKYPFTTGWNRRSFRSSDITDYMDKFKDIMYDFHKKSAVDASVEDILSGNVSDKEQTFEYMRSGECYQLVYEIDKGNQFVIDWARNAIEGGGADITYSLFRVIFRSSNEELQELVCKLLLAARLQEGLRQAVCETCDSGTVSAFLKVMNVIKDNDLIRYSSVKRAVGTWSGLIAYDAKDLDRISNKTLELMCSCLDSEEYMNECLSSEDAMKIYIGLWALACNDFVCAAKKIEDYIENGSHQQILVSGHFMNNFLGNHYKNRLSQMVIFTHSDELDLIAMYLPGLMSNLNYYNSKQSEKDNLEKAFQSRKTAEQVYDILMDLYRRIPKKAIEFSPCVFPWNAEQLTKSDIVRKNSRIAAMLGDNDRIDEMCRLIPEIDISGYGSRRQTIEMLLSKPATDIQLDALVSLAGDREEYARTAVFEILKTVKLKDKHYAELENMLRYKAADIRSNIIAILFRQSDEGLFDCVQRLVSDKKEEKRTAGLDIIMQLKDKDDRKALAEKCVPLVSLIEDPTSKEKILIDQIKPSDGKKQEKVYGYGLYKEEDGYTPVVSEEFTAKCYDTFARYFPASKIGKKSTGVFGALKNAVKSSGDREQSAEKNLKKLSDLIEENKNLEFTDEWGETSLLGSARNLYCNDEDNNRVIAFKEMWEDFYRNEIKTPEQLVRMSVAMCYSANGHYGADCFMKGLTSKLFGSDIAKETSYAHASNMGTVLMELRNEYTNNDDKLLISCALANYLADEVPLSELISLTEPTGYYKPVRWYYDGKVKNTEKFVCAAFNDCQISFILGWLKCPRKDNISDVFAIEYKLSEKFGWEQVRIKMAEKGVSGYRNEAVTYERPDVASLVRTAFYGGVSEGFMYKTLMTGYGLKSVLKDLSLFAKEYRESEKATASRYRYWGGSGLSSLLKINSRKVDVSQLSEEDKQLAEFASSVYDRITAVVLDTELNRGDTETEFSSGISGLVRIYGAERFVRILAAMGKDTLERSTYFHYNTAVSKKSSFSYLLGICVPDPEDNADRLRELISKTDVTEKRIVEAALYSPEWIDMVAEYLGWEGFKSACYYFMAHMNEYLDDKRKAVIAKFTPISSEDLMNGAFDIDWFREAYETVGKKRFDVIYGAAKYISDGAKHSRARKYADAVLGKLDKSAAEEQINDKRNKDTLMAYTLIPLENEDDLLSRYMFLQAFKKQSRQFGAQRKASEGLAVEIGMQNLAKNAGFADVTRLTLRMETKMFDDIRELLDEHVIGDITVRLNINEDGKAEIVCQKGGKTLKSVPAKYKKDEYIVRLGEVKKQLTEQFRRTKLMLEQAMEDRTSFTAGEINMLCGNPVVKPLVANLVYKRGNDIGFAEGMELVSPAGKRVSLNAEDELVPAHCYDLYEDGTWHEYQKSLFDRKIKQPFKQVFRELYVKTEDEKDALNSRRYAGNQIQPKQTVACLKSRRWVADVEDGLQKIYYKENIIARIYALADWFSPADIEAPTLEWVEFSDRKTGETLKIRDIPDIIFSEVMRDVDLAVSVAHAGGVDPETSHSTVEMRRAIAEFTMPLFKLKNVTFEKSHAFIKGELADYSIHLGSGVVHIQGGPMINVLPVHSQHRGKLFLPFADEDPKTAQVISEILLFAEDKKIKDPFILNQIR